ncbi:MAG: nucleotidyltransferase [Segetibacter sp.]|nr:nucleotidyltransferase [Segetibacter sp.]
MTLIDTYINDIKLLCGKHRVKRLYTFGSINTGNFTNDSDIDFIVYFDNIDASQYADNYFDFKFALQDTLKRSIDLLEEKAIKNPFFKQAVESKRQLIYG